MKKYIIAFILLFLQTAVFAAELVIPDARKIDWTTAGVPGGIPTITNICETDECNTLYAGTVTKASIDAAVTSASSTNPIVIRIPAGTYDVEASITIQKKNIILRGAGMNSTILNVTNDGVFLTLWGWGESANESDLIDITDGGISKGGTSFTTASVSYVNVGAKIYLRANNTADMMNPYGAQMPIQPVVVTEVTGSGPYTVSFEPAAITDFTDTPKYRVSSKDRNGYADLYGNGIEDLTISGYASSTSSYLINMYAWKSWVKNVKLYAKGTTSNGIYMANSFQCTVQACWIDMVDSSHDDCTAINIYTGRSNVVTDNVLVNLRNGIVNVGGNGNVLSYNYITKNRTVLSGNPWYQTSGINGNHGGEPMYNLYEGNIVNGFMSDGYHSGSLSDTLFRNNFHGINGYAETKDYQWRQPVRLCRWARKNNVIGNVLGSSSWDAEHYEEEGYQLYDYDRIYSLGRPNMGNNAYYETLTLDVAPTPAWSAGQTITGSSSGVTAYIEAVTSSTSYTIATRKPWVFNASIFGTAFTDGEELCVSTNCADQGDGYPQVTNKDNTVALNSDGGSDNRSGYDYDVRTTILRHKNYDYYTDSVTICNDANNTEGCQSATNVAAEDTIPNSLYLTAQPSWWCTETTWPPIDPSGPTVSKIPAQRRYEGLTCNGGVTMSIGSGAAMSIGSGATLTLQ